MDDLDAFYSRLGKEIQRLRGKRGLTQAALAKRVELNRTSVTNIEQGRQRLLLHTLVDFARALGTDPANLIPATEPTSDVPAGLAPPAKDFVDRVFKRNKETQVNHGHPSKANPSSRSDNS